MKTFTNTIQNNDAISRVLDAEAIDLAFTLVQHRHSFNKQLEEDVVLIEFREPVGAEEFSDTAIDYINRCTEHTAGRCDQLPKTKSQNWGFFSYEVYLPCIQIRFAAGVQVEGELLTDHNGKPYGVIVTAVYEDEDIELLDTVIRF